MSQKNIVIEVSGGVVTDVHGLPAGFTYEIADWDDAESGDQEEHVLEEMIAAAQAEPAEALARYTIYIEHDQFPDPERYPQGIAYRSGIIDENGEEIDGSGDIATYEEARELALSTLNRLIPDHEENN